MQINEYMKWYKDEIGLLSCYSILLQYPITVAPIVTVSRNSKAMVKAYEYAPYKVGTCRGVAAEMSGRKFKPGAKK